MEMDMDRNYVSLQDRCVPGDEVDGRLVPDGKGGRVKMRIFKCKWCDNRAGRSGFRHLRCKSRPAASQRQSALPPPLATNSNTV